MHLTDKEWWGLIHGMGFGRLFLLAFAGALASLYSLRPGLVTARGVVERMRRLKIGVTAMTVAASGTVLTGRIIVYPWYRDPSGPVPAQVDRTCGHPPVVPDDAVGWSPLLDGCCVLSFVL
jgi:hypothetical protein